MEGFLGFETEYNFNNRQKEDSNFKNTYIKQMIAINKNIIANAESKSHSDNFISYKVNDNFNEDGMSVESKILSQVKSIRLDAEKQIGNKISNAVLIVPTHFNLRQSNALKNVANIAGLESVVLSQMSAALIGFADQTKQFNDKLRDIFLLTINDFESNAAVCSISDGYVE